jgi:hypothetical protein
LNEEYYAVNCASYIPRYIVGIKIELMESGGVLVNGKWTGRCKHMLLHNEGAQQEKN